MANTYTQLIIQLVFVVKGRQKLVSSDLKPRLEKYITGIVQNNGHKLLTIFCMPDHCHVLIGLHPTQSISDLVRDIKSNSSKWINENQLIKYKFSWQSGYAAFSYSKSAVSKVGDYIDNQYEHHRKTSFQDEYVQFLKSYDIDFDPKYLFD